MRSLAMSQESDLMRMSPAREAWQVGQAYTQGGRGIVLQGASSSMQLAGVQLSSGPQSC